MRNAFERGFSEKALSLALFYGEISHLILNGDKGKLQNFSFTLASTAKLTTSSHRQAKFKRKYESIN